MSYEASLVLYLKNFTHIKCDIIFKDLYLFYPRPNWRLLKIPYHVIIFYD